MVRRRCRLLFCLAVALLIAAAPKLAAAQSRAQLEKARQRLVREDVVGAGVKDKRVIESILATPRHEFVPFQLREKAYFDMALPIGAQQTISSPFIVAYMTESLDVQPTDKVLEIGTGSGYQAAVLAPLAKQVYTIEIVPTLGKKATRTLKRLNYKNVFVKIGDGFKGWPEHAPFDKIIVTCSPEKIPQPLVDQLQEGGLMVIPVGERYQQTLYLMRKRDGRLQREALRPTLFVPMTGAAEEARQVKPDPQRPAIVNGGFEEPPQTKSGFLTGWYYQRKAHWESDPKTPQGLHYVRFHNEDAGLSAHLLQGFAIDGGSVESLDLSAWVKTTKVAPGKSLQELPVVAITFYDENRKELGSHWLGPFQGTSDWLKTTKTIKVPITAREGILRLGLFGAVGSIGFDDVQITPIPRK